MSLSEMRYFIYFTYFSKKKAYSFSFTEIFQATGKYLKFYYIYIVREID